MKDLKDYKEEVAQTRVGCLGGSDGKMLAQVASLGAVPRSALKRLAICKGLIPQVEIPKNAAIQAGDDIEMAIYQYLSANDERYESNPLLVSEKYSTKNVKLIAHPDFLLKDDARKTLFAYECKTTKYGVEETRQTYKAQLFIEFVLAKELASTFGSNWSVKLFLVHYDTNGLDLEQGVEFVPSRMTLREVRFSNPFFDIKKSMTIIDDFMETFTEYYDGEEVESEYLPANIKEQFIAITNVINEIKEREKQVDEFKRRLTVFMKQKGIKSIKSDNWNMTFVDDTESVSFDYKAFLNDLTNKHPRKANKLLRTYEKRTKRDAYVKIALKK